MEYRVWQNAWRGDAGHQVTLSLPDDWNVSFQSMPGDAWPRLTEEQIRDKINAPAGMERISRLAAKGTQAVIAFDDLSRATPASKIIPAVLDELHAGGIEDSNIRFICATGNHGPLNRAELVMKLGEEVVENYLVYNHNPYEHCVSIGKNSHGEEVLVNEEFMKCDVRIGIGCVSPHPMNGYGGGGKLIFPGLAHIDTTEANHRRREVAVPGDKNACGLRRDIEEMTRMAGSFFKIDVVMNAALDIIDLYAGDPVQEYYQAVESSARANCLILEEPKDVVFANANAKYNEAFIAIKIGQAQLKPGGDIVLINHCAGGVVIHYLYGQAGKEITGRCILPTGQTLPGGGRVICYTPYPGRNPQQWDMIQVKTWDEVMALLRERHGAGTAAAILSDGSIAYYQ